MENEKKLPPRIVIYAPTQYKNLLKAQTTFLEHGLIMILTETVEDTIRKLNEEEIHLFIIESEGLKEPKLVSSVKTLIPNVVVIVNRVEENVMDNKSAGIDKYIYGPDKDKKLLKLCNDFFKKSEKNEITLEDVLYELDEVRGRVFEFGQIIEHENKTTKERLEILEDTNKKLTTVVKGVEMIKVLIRIFNNKRMIVILLGWLAILFGISSNEVYTFLEKVLPLLK